MLIVVYDVNVLLIVLTTQRDGFDKGIPSDFFRDGLGLRDLTIRFRICLRFISMILMTKNLC